MSDVEMKKSSGRSGQERLKKSDRRAQILLELKLTPHVRISELSRRFNVSSETVRRDLDSLADDGLIARAHGGASAPAQGHYPSLDERANARTKERELIGMQAARLVRDGETIMIDSGSTTIQLARALAYLGTSCTVITNSIPVAMMIGHGAADVLLAPGEYLATESAVVGTETVEFLTRFSVDRCFVGASGLSTEGPSEAVRGFAAVKRAMLGRTLHGHLLIDSQKFGRKDLSLVGELSNLESVVVDTRPRGDLLAALDGANVEILVAEKEA